MILFTAILLISACADPQQNQNSLTSDWGPYPENYQDIIKNYMQNRLFDPESALYNWYGLPFPARSSSYGNIKYGYQMKVGINAKNRMGGYTGEQIYYFFINNAIVVDEKRSNPF